VEHWVPSVLWNHTPSEKLYFGWDPYFFLHIILFFTTGGREMSEKTVFEKLLGDAQEQLAADGDALVCKYIRGTLVLIKSREESLARARGYLIELEGDVDSGAAYREDYVPPHRVRGA
jgi:hypothetical protein